MVTARGLSAYDELEYLKGVFPMQEFYDERQPQPPFGTPPFGGPPGGGFGPPFGFPLIPPFGQPGGSPFTPPGQVPGGTTGTGPPSGPPPSFVPSQAQAQQTVGVYAVDPGAIRPCRFRYVYLWLDNGQQFWAWLVFVGRRSASGWRWIGFRWIYFGVDLDRITAFVCY